MALGTNATDADFQQRVLERSHEVPVVVDFWAPWCGPCRSLGPVLERLAEESSGRWELVKVNVDDNPGLAVRYGIQGIPAVKAFFEGSEVAQFVGAQPRLQVEAWLQTFLPDPAQDLVAAGEDAERRGDLTSARSLYEKALALNPESPAARRGLERVDLVEDASTADEAELKARLETDPGNLETATALSKLKLARDDPDFGEPLVNVISISADPAVRKAAQGAFLKLLEVLPAGDQRAFAARRRLASILYP